MTLTWPRKDPNAVGLDINQNARIVERRDREDDKKGTGRLVVSASITLSKFNLEMEVIKKKGFDIERIDDNR